MLFPIGLKMVSVSTGVVDNLKDLIVVYTEQEKIFTPW